MFKAEIIDKDLGFQELVQKIDNLTQPKSLIVGIVEASPRSQFRLGTAQEFRPETAGLLLRGPIDAKKDEIIKKLGRIGRSAFEKGVSPDQELLKLGNEIKADMDAQTDPPPQLRTSIIVKLEDAS